MQFANCMGCDFQSYNQIYSWTNMSWNFTAYFLDFRTLLLTECVIVLCVYDAHACSFNYKCIIMLCVYCMSEWSVEICQAFDDPDRHLGRCVLFTSNAISLWCLMNQISSLQTNIKKLLHDSNTLYTVEFWSIYWWFDEILCRHILVNICVLLYRGNPFIVNYK